MVYVDNEGEIHFARQFRGEPFPGMQVLRCSETANFHHAHVNIRVSKRCVVLVKPNDWIVLSSDGIKRVVSNAVFHRRYKWASEEIKQSLRPKLVLVDGERLLLTRFGDLYPLSWIERLMVRLGVFDEEYLEQRVLFLVPR